MTLILVDGIYYFSDNSCFSICRKQTNGVNDSLVSITDKTSSSTHLQVLFEEKRFHYNFTASNDTNIIIEGQTNLVQKSQKNPVCDIANIDKMALKYFEIQVNSEIVVQIAARCIDLVKFIKFSDVQFAVSRVLDQNCFFASEFDGPLIKLLFNANSKTLVYNTNLKKLMEFFRAEPFTQRQMLDFVSKLPPPSLTGFQQQLLKQNRRLFKIYNNKILATGELGRLDRRDLFDSIRVCGFKYFQNELTMYQYQVVSSQNLAKEGTESVVVSQQLLEAAVLFADLELLKESEAQDVFRDLASSGTEEAVDQFFSQKTKSQVGSQVKLNKNVDESSDEFALKLRLSAVEAKDDQKLLTRAEVKPQHQSQQASAINPIQNNPFAKQTIVCLDSESEHEKQPSQVQQTSAKKQQPQVTVQQLSKDPEVAPVQTKKIRLSENAPTFDFKQIHSKFKFNLTQTQQSQQAPVVELELADSDEEPPQKQALPVTQVKSIQQNVMLKSIQDMVSEQLRDGSEQIKIVPQGATQISKPLFRFDSSEEKPGLPTESQSLIKSSLPVPQAAKPELAKIEQKPTEYQTKLQIIGASGAEYDVKAKFLTLSEEVTLRFGDRELHLIPRVSLDLVSQKRGVKTATVLSDPKLFL